MRDLKDSTNISIEVEGGSEFNSFRLFVAYLLVTLGLYIILISKFLNFLHCR